MTARTLWAVAAAALVAAAPAPAQGDGNKYLDRTKLDVGLDELVEQIADILAKREAKELKLAEVVCPASKDDPHAAGLEAELRVRLERKVKLADGAMYDLRVEYGFERRAGGREEAYILATLRKGGQVDNTLPKLARIPSDDMRDKLRTYSGGCVSVSRPTEATAAKRDEEFRADREKPQAHVSGVSRTRVSARPAGKYYVELVAGPKDGKGPLVERAPTVEGGVAVAQIDTDEEYRVRIGNTSSSEVACRVFIDGIDVSHFTDDRQPNGDPRYKHLIVPAGKVVEVPGWHKTAAKDRKDNWQAFVVTEFGKGRRRR